MPDTTRASRPPSLPEGPPEVVDAVAALPARADSMSLRETVRRGGVAILALAVPLVMMEQLVRDATTTLAPDIQRTFQLEDWALIAVLGFSGVALTVGGPFAAFLADRTRRRYLVFAFAAIGTLALLGAFFATEIWQIFACLTLTGLAGAYSNPVFGSLIAEAYPAEGRGKVYSFHAMATPLGQLLGPTLAGSIAALAGAGPDSWRYAYLGLALPYAILAISSLLFLKEPPRGGAVYAAATGSSQTWEKPIGFFAAFRRMVKIRTYLFLCMGIGSLGLALYAVPIQMSLLFEGEYQLDALQRGLVFSLTQVPVIIAMIFGGRLFDRLFQVNPARTMYLALIGIIGFGLLIVGGIWVQPLPLLIAVYVLAMVFNGLTLVSVSAIIASVTPPRYMAQAFAVMTLFTFLMGGFFGAVFSGVISESFGFRVALAIAVGVSAVVAGLFYLLGSRHHKADAARVADEIAADAAAFGGIKEKA
jgi:MFS family permease